MTVPMNLNTSMQSTATGRAENSFAGSSSSYGSGAWNVNLGGTGQANFAANATAAGSGGGMPSWVWIAAAVGAAWLLLK